MILAIVFAELWAVCQLIVLGTFTRTVRVRTVFMAVAVGLYACAPLAVLMQVTWIHAAAWLTGTPAYQLVKVASYTADPFIEEVVKVVPVVLLLTIPAIRRQWSITDCVLVSAACGAGFGLAEELYMFGTVSTSALFRATFGGWMLPGIAATPTVPSPWTTVTSWLPPGVLPNELLTLSLNHYPAINLHLAWSAVGGLAIGLMWLRREWMSRIAGALLLLYVAIDHALNNARVSTGFSLMRNVLAVMPIVALGIAWWFDRFSQRSSEEPVLAAEKAASWRFLGTLQVAVSRLPGSLSQLFGFVRMRRAHNSAQSAGRGDPEGLRAAVVSARDRIERDLVAPQSSSRWLPIGWTRSNVFGALRQPAVILRLVLMTPSFLWFVVGGWPQTASVQKMMTGPIVWQIVVALSVLSQALILWRVIGGVRAWPRALRLVIGDDTAIAGLGVASGTGAASLSGYALLRVVTGLSPTGQFLYSYHVIDAWTSLAPAAALFLGGPAAGLFLWSAKYVEGLLYARDAEQAGRDAAAWAASPAGKAAADAEAKAAWQKAQAGFESALVDYADYSSYVDVASAIDDKAVDSLAVAHSEVDAALANGDSDAIIGAKHAEALAFAAARDARAGKILAEAQLQGARAARDAAEAKVQEARRAYESATKARVQADIDAKAAAARPGDHHDPP